VKFLTDESVEKPVVDWLRNQSFDVMYIAEKTPCISDDEDVLRLANNEDRVLITNDKDFGELVFHQARIALGIILIRATNEKSSNKVRLVREVLEKVGNKLAGSFIVVNEAGIRMKKISKRQQA